MIKNINDTIAAISTPKGTGGISILRISGTNSLDIAKKLSKKNILEEKINRVKIFDENKNLLDYGIILFFKKPKSFTGENLIEFHIHGSETITNFLLLNIIKAGARLAEPGEFTLRAYLNGKIDLIQAESINYLINSETIIHNNLILKSLSGFFSKDLKIIIKRILNLRYLLEGSIEFPDDIQNNTNKFFNYFIETKILFDNLYNKLYLNHFLEDKLRIVIIGDVNVGKSSLFNLLLKNDRSIVSNTPGTTRDFIENDFYMFGSKTTLIDTAGFNDITNCDIEKISISKTFEQIKKSSIIIYMTDINNNFDETKFNNFLKFFLKNKIKIFLLKNKIDVKNINENIFYYKNYSEILISVKKNKGVNILIEEIKKITINIKEKMYIINKRNYNLFIKIKKNLIKIKNLNKKNFLLDVQAEILKETHDLLLEILGKNTSTDIIKEIFSKFCIGK